MSDEPTQSTDSNTEEQKSGTSLGGTSKGSQAYGAPPVPETSKTTVETTGTKGNTGSYGAS